MASQQLWYLENIDVNGLFCPKKSSHLEEQHTHRTFKKGEYIFLPEEMADKVYFLTQGQIKIGTYGENGKEITKALLRAGEVFGELALVTKGKRRDFAYAMQESSVCILSVVEMKSLMRDRNGLALFIMKILGSRVLDMENRLESLVFKDSRSRIVEFLVGLNAKRGQRVGYEWVVRNFITHQEIANITATSRQSVTTVLNELRTRNLITFNRKRLLIRDLEALKAEIKNT